MHHWNQFIILINKIKTYCYKNQIKTDEEIAAFCKSMIHPSIKISGTSLNEIANSLKEDISFIYLLYIVVLK